MIFLNLFDFNYYYIIFQFFLCNLFSGFYSGYPQFVFTNFASGYKKVIKIIYRYVKKTLRLGSYFEKTTYLQPLLEAKRAACSSQASTKKCEIGNSHLQSLKDYLQSDYFKLKNRSFSEDQS